MTILSDIFLASTIVRRDEDASVKKAQIWGHGHLIYPIHGSKRNGSADFGSRYVCKSRTPGPWDVQLLHFRLKGGAAK